MVGRLFPLLKSGGAPRTCVNSSKNKGCALTKKAALVVTMCFYVAAVSTAACTNAVGFAMADEAVANIKPICDANGILGSSLLLQPRDLGESYASSSCDIGANVLLNISGYALPVVGDVSYATDNRLEQSNPKPIPAANAVHFVDGSVGEGSAIIVHMPEESATLAPIDVVVRGNSFGRNAAIRFIGSLSAHSRITIEDNVFAMDDRNPFMKDIAMISAFSITYVRTEPLPFYTNSSLVIRKNQMKCVLLGDTTLGYQQYAAAPISCLSGFYFHAHSKIIIDDNTLIAQCTPSEMFACAFGVMWSTIIFGVNGTCSISQNKFNVNRGIAGFTPALEGEQMTGIYNNNSGTIDSSGLFDVYNGAMKIRTGTLQKDSLVEIKYNEFESKGSATGLVFEPKTVVYDNSRVEVAYNKLRSLGGGDGGDVNAASPFLAFEDQVMAHAGSKVWVYGNTMESLGDTGFTNAPIRFHNPMVATTDSDICVFGNEAIGAKDSDTAYLVQHFGDQQNVTVDNTSTISLCNNSYKGHLVMGKEAMRITTSPTIAISSTADPCAHGCPSVNPSVESTQKGPLSIPTTSTTTTTTTTTTSTYIPPTSTFAATTEQPNDDGDGFTTNGANAISHIAAAFSFFLAIMTVAFMA